MQCHAYSEKVQRKLDKDEEALKQMAANTRAVHTHAEEARNENDTLRSELARLRISLAVERHTAECARNKVKVLHAQVEGACSESDTLHSELEMELTSVEHAHKNMTTLLTDLVQGRRQLEVCVFV